MDKTHAGPTVIDVFDEHAPYGLSFAWLHEALKRLGIDPNMPAAQLKEDLPVAARVRQAKANGWEVRHGSKSGGSSTLAVTLLEWLQGQ